MMVQQRIKGAGIEMVFEVDFVAWFVKEPLI